MKARKNNVERNLPLFRLYDALVRKLTRTPFMLCQQSGFRPFGNGHGLLRFPSAKDYQALLG